MFTDTRVGVYLVAYTLVMIGVVYALRLPQWVTGQPALVDEYYVHQRRKSFVLDLGFVSVYFAVAWGLIVLVGARTVPQQGLAVAATTVALTTLAWAWYTRNPLQPTDFFSRWFHTVGHRAAVYDTVLLSLIYALSVALFGGPLFPSPPT